jgi:hypothetical protein
MTVAPERFQPSDALRLLMRIDPHDWKGRHDVLSLYVELASKEEWPRDVIAAQLPPGYSLCGWIDCLQGRINYPEMGDR